MLVLAAACALSACSADDSYRRCEGVVWGTTYHIVYRADSDLTDSVTAVMNSVDMAVSPFNPASAVSAVNAGADTVTEPMLIRLIEESRRLSAATDGAFDPTVAPLVNLWGFGYRKADGTPDSAAVDSALATVGIADCHIGPNGVLKRKHPQTEFDFSAIAKGMGVDRVAAMLRRNGSTDYMVEIGGEVATMGLNASRRPWRISVDLPVADLEQSRRGIGVIEPGNACMATSGNYRNYLTDSTGTRYGHTISTSTGRPVEVDILSATVIAPECMTADALATAAMAAGSSRAMEWTRRMPGVKIIAVIADHEAPSGMRVVTSDSIPWARKGSY